MKEITTYYAEGSSQTFYNKEDALREEGRIREISVMRKLDCPNSKLTVLKIDLENCLYVSPETMATCTFDSLRIKGMVRVCRKFVEENKKYLNYY